MTTKSTCRHRSRQMLLVAGLAVCATFAANAADAGGVKLKVTGVAVLDEAQGDRAKVKYLPPGRRGEVCRTSHGLSEKVGAQSCKSCLKLSRHHAICGRASPL